MMGRLMEPSAVLLALKASAPGGMTRTLFAGKDACKQPRAVAVCEAANTAPNPPPGEKADAGSRASMAINIDKHAICQDGVSPAIAMIASWIRLSLLSSHSTAAQLLRRRMENNWYRYNKERFFDDTT